MLGSRLLSRVFGSKREEGTEEWRKVHNEKIQDLYFSRNNFRVIKVSKIRWPGNVAHMAEKRHAYRILVWKPEGKE